MVSVKTKKKDTTSQDQLFMTINIGSLIQNDSFTPKVLKCNLFLAGTKENQTEQNAADFILFNFLDLSSEGIFLGQKIKCLVMKSWPLEVVSAFCLYLF